MAIHIGRRKFLSALGGAVVAWPFAARAQQNEKKPRIGFLSSFTAEGGRDLIGCFQKGMQQFGWIDQQTISIDYRWAEGRAEQYSVLAMELARLNPDLIACNSTPATQALQRATHDIPVVFMGVSDPVASGIVRSLARPEANITGVSNFLPATTAKLLELLQSIVPHLAHVFVLRDPANAGKSLEVQELQSAAPVVGVTLEVVDVRNALDIERAFSAITQKSTDAVVTLSDGVTLSHRVLIQELAAEKRIPAIYQTKPFVDAGGLMSYGLNYCQHFRRAAFYVDKILKGAKPTDLPVELPTTFELVINLKTAKALGLEIPPQLLTLADEVIE